MKNRAKILYVEDEPSLGTIVNDALVTQGYEVRWETDGSKVLPLVKDFEPDLCVLDIMLPGIDGLSLCRAVRGQDPYLPVIFLTARTDTSHLVEGFEAGGTDYIKKPFSIEELIVRIENQLKITVGRYPSAHQEETIAVGSFLFDMNRYELRSNLGIIKLSNRDMQILRILCSNMNRVTSRKDILMAVWGDDSYFNSRTLDVYIRKLRKHLSTDDSIQLITLKSNGYLFLVSED